MTAYVIKGNDKNPVQAVKELFSKLLENQVDYIFLPGKSPYSKLPMPMLISDTAHMENLEPLAPAAPFNSAKQAASVLKSNTNKKIAFLLKPCEKRALVELVKLSQCSIENALIITADCLGRMENSTYLGLIEDAPGLIEAFLQDKSFQDKITSSCSVCTQFTDSGSDIHVNLIGCSGSAVFVPQTENGEAVFKKFECDRADIPTARENEVEQITKKHTENMETLSDNVLSKTKDVEKFQELIATCLNCYNCRTACPVCYCKECVFLTDIFNHMPETLLNRADKKGIIKLPTDTTMFHMTRLAHMSHACVGCGHCSSVCPSNIPVADIFKIVSKNTQDFFGYIPGENTDEKIPYLNYKKEN